ncbi:hypothetical protein VKT23_013527 [Stygiomarasmius scandens]|uniref:F-box domain-containing protein n=1 Tax=Marasmiellus scandens TaxID=2682957 RepID=A0ABR1J2N4_9AGAR
MVELVESQGVLSLKQQGQRNWTEQGSRFNAFFNTNYAPSDAEVGEIKEIVRGPERELAVLDEEITRVESILGDLKSRRKKISLFVDSHLSLCTAFRRLSPELLSEIFVHCLPSEHLPTRCSHEAPLLLLRICKRWREIALGTPRLWCRLHVHVPNHLLDVPLMHRRITGIDEWLGRSGETPISLSLYCPRKMKHYSGEFEHSGQALDVFITRLAKKYSYRWKRLELTLPWDVLTKIMSLEPTDIPALEYLSITHSSFHDFDSAAVVEFTKKIPKLRGLTLNHHPAALQEFTNSHFKLSSGSLNVENLTELTLHSLWSQYPPASDLLKLLEKAVNLRSCVLDMFIHSNPSSGQLMTAMQRSSYPFLHTLSLTFSHDSHEAAPGTLLVPVFEAINAPNLESLSVHAPNFMVTEGRIPFLEMLTSRITSIVFDVQMTAEAWIQCLYRVPKLSSIGGKCGESDYIPVKAHTNKWEKVLRLLAPTEEDADILCPELKSIDFSLVQDFGAKELIGLVAARQRMASNGNSHRHQSKKLSSVAAWLGSYERLTEDDWAEISRLREGGTDIYLRIPPGIGMMDTPWTGLQGVSLLDGREIKWSWPDEHTADYTGLATIYSTTGPKGSLVARMGI